MLEKLKADFDAIIELVKKAPPALQEMAFKMVLEQWFIANTPSKPAGAATPGTVASVGAAAHGSIPETVKPFLTANGITADILEKVFHPTWPVRNCSSLSSRAMVRPANWLACRCC